MMVALILILLALACSIAGFFFFGKTLGWILEIEAIVLFLISLWVDSESKTEIKYPASEYRLDYEIITRGEQVDTVYVLTRK